MKVCFLLLGNFQSPKETISHILQFWNVREKALISQKSGPSTEVSVFKAELSDKYGNLH